MLTRLDHVIIAVRDLDPAIAAYERLGFRVIRGGANPGAGTHNALIRFGLDYLELLSVADRDAAQTVALRGRELVAYLDGHEGGLLSYVMASDDVHEDTARAEAHGFAMGAPVAMQRLRPDGRLLRWQLVVPGDPSFRRPWPLLIEWETPDETRLTWEPPADHPNGASCITRLAVAVRSPDAARSLYEQQLGLTIERITEIASLDALSITTRVGAHGLDLITPAVPDRGPIAAGLAKEGEGPIQVTLGVRNIGATRDFLAKSGLALTDGVFGQGLALDVSESLGARLAFVEVR